MAVLAAVISIRGKHYYVSDAIFNEERAKAYMHGMSKCVRPEQIPNNINIINRCLDEIAYTRQASICGNNRLDVH